MSNDIDETAAGGRKNPDNRIVDATSILTGGDALDLVSVDSGDRAKTYLIDLDLIAAAFSGGLTLGQLNFFGNSGSQGTDGRETLDLLKEIEATGDDRRDPGTFVDDGGSRQRLELFADDGSGGAVAADDLIALILAAIAGEADLDFFETDTGFDIHIGGRWSTDILRFEGATAQQLAEDLLPPVNTAPDAVDDAISITEGTGVGTPGPGVLGNDTDPDGDDLTIISVNGDAANVGAPLSGAGGLTYTILSSGGFSVSSSDNSLGAGESVTETITYTVSDGNGRTDTASFVVTINGRNDDPDAVDDVITLTAGETLTDVLSVILANDSDPDGDDLSLPFADVVFDPTFFDLAGFDVRGFDGVVTDFEITAFEGVSGTTSFTYGVSDGNGGTDTATVTVIVEGAVEIPDPISITASAGGSYEDGMALGGVPRARNDRVTLQDSSEDFNGFFVFDVPDLQNEVASATISLEYSGVANIGTLFIYDVDTPIGELTDENYEEFIFNDLETGDLYASTDYELGLNTVELELSADALEDLGAASGGQFAIGLTMFTPEAFGAGIRFAEAGNILFPEIELTFSDQLLS